MSEENFKQKPIEAPAYLNEEEQKIWLEANDIMNSYNADLFKEKVSMEKMDEIQDKIINFKEELEKSGIDPYKYLLFHNLIGSTVSGSRLELDTNDHVIGKFIKDLYAEYNK
jgi:predicted HTH domain antitoxin